MEGQVRTRDEFKQVILQKFKEEVNVGMIYEEIREIIKMAEQLMKGYV